MKAGRPWSERGVVGGADGLAFSVLILLAGTLMLTNAWSIVETRVAVDAATREYLRSYTRQSDHTSARRAAEAAARSALESRGTPLSGLRITAPDPARFGPCGEATVALDATVPGLRIPFLGELTSTVVTVRHSELIDAHREVEADDRFDPQSTPCGGS